MYFYVTTAKGKRTCKAEKDKHFMPETKIPKTINKGDKCLVFCNGTIGQGRQAYNYSKKEAIKMLNKLLDDIQS